MRSPLHHGVTVEGHAWLRSRDSAYPMWGPELARFVRSSLDEDAGRLRQLTGSFFFAERAAGSCRLVTDQVGSYGAVVHAHEPRLVARTDEAAWPVDNEVGVACLLSCGHTLGTDTLSSRLIHVPPGTIAEWRGGAWRFQRYRTNHRLSPDPEGDVDGLLAGVETAFRRTAEFVGDRIALVPLSGGLDSRLVLTGLVDQGVHVQAFTYGHPESYEVGIAREVATALSVPWTFVEYGPEAHQAALEFADRSRFRQITGAYSSTPNWQELSAFLQLAQLGLPLEGACVVPGFSADLPAGSYLPLEYGDEGAMSSIMDRGIARYVHQRHFQLNRSRVNDRAIARRLDTYFDGVIPTEPDDFVSHHEAWVTDERVAKFVVQGVRTYELFGCDWTLPLWDDDLVEPLRRTPNELRRNERFYAQTLTRRIFAPAGLPGRLPEPRRRQSPLARTIGRRLPREQVVRVKQLVDRLVGTRTHDFNDFESLATLAMSRRRRADVEFVEVLNEVMSIDHLLQLGYPI